MRSSAFLAVLVVLAGCLGTGPSPGVAPDGVVGSEGGLLEGEFHASPSSPVTGENRLDMVLSAPDGSPLTGARAEVEPWMAVHGHGANVVPVVEERGGGRYEVTDLVFTMPGPWELHVQVEAEGLEDRFVLPYEVR